MTTSPVLGGIFEDPVELAGLESLQTRDFILEVGVTDAIEIEHAAAHRFAIGPVIGAPRIDNRLAPVDGVDAIGAAGNRRILDDLIEGFAVAPFAREHRQRAQDHVQLVVATLEFETHRAFIGRGDRLHIGKEIAVARMRQLAHQRLVGMPHIGRQHRVAI